MGWFFEDRVERLTDAQLRNRTKCRKKKQKIKKKIRGLAKDLPEDMLFMFVVGIIVVFATAVITLA